MSASIRLLAIAFAAGLVVTGANAAEPGPLETRIDAFAKTWAHINFEIQDKSVQAQEAERLAHECDMLAQQYPGRAEPLVWEAITESTEAGAKGGLAGLGLAKSARAHLERAEKINPTALGDGSVYTSLGSLYAQVPGFPIGFGDAGKARAYFQKALAANPDGIDANFFYGDFLIRQHDYAGAIRVLEKALAAPPRPGREVADRGRRAEAVALLKRANHQLK